MSVDAPKSAPKKTRRGGANKGRGWETEAAAILSSFGLVVVPHAVPRGPDGSFSRGAAPPDASVFFGAAGGLVDYKEVHADRITVAAVRASQRAHFDRVELSAVVVRFVMPGVTFRGLVPWRTLKAAKTVRASECLPLTQADVRRWMGG